MSKTALALLFLVKQFHFRFRKQGTLYYSDDAPVIKRETPT